MSICTLCPRQCGVDRITSEGFCGMHSKARIARAALHFWEEPCISGTQGSGTIFFSGCTLKCCFCQNFKISSEGFGKDISNRRLADIMLELQDKGANNINLVSATHFLDNTITALNMCKDRLHIPVVYNSSGYETTDTVKKLDGYVDIYLPDLKYFDDDIAIRYSRAPHYFDIATDAIKEMFRQVGKTVIKDGIMQKGVIIRHLVLPTHRYDSFKILDWIADSFDKNDIFISIMSQYTPCYKSKEFPEINRRISTFEYNKVVDYATKLGLNGFMQEKSSAKEEYTPDFDLTGI